MNKLSLYRQILKTKCEMQPILLVGDILPISSLCNLIDYLSITYLCQTEDDLIHIDM